ncbi:DJ-1/PfpI family protein [Aspergillus clavatus NRRL 1]|uniref:ThiJ/PfpI family protein n=1 Tax=Aspergillus clavatus (strain ATCC 1007 / CBS 513.65 / DSM 816 / NCTC 3887 / NRRL 1 / QM 1276 / 107) TaxID=344612 RepID=A1CJE2_ASPCL|nr:ThiJ/PfpI family protein [Aspergillus clavatus NRRL 1]EAW09266.1 ThiJ/PfpI family protein [Aspergillus clavatus NRRL 1]
MSPPLRIGVLLVNTVQLLDLAAVDLFYMIDPSYLSACSLPKPLIDLGRPVQIHYIGKSGPNTHQDTTSNLSLQLTASLTDKAVQPHALDILLIPGPEPSTVPDDAYLDFVRAHHDAGTHVLSICTGILVVAHAGIANGKRATGPRMLVPMLRENFPDVAVWDASRRVVRDGNLWCSGGITNGHDLVAQYLRTIVAEPLVKTILAMADVPERSLSYESAVTTDNFFFLWQVLKALPTMLFRSIKG